MLVSVILTDRNAVKEIFLWKKGIISLFGSLKDVLKFHGLEVVGMS